METCGSYQTLVRCNGRVHALETLQSRLPRRHNSSPELVDSGTRDSVFGALLGFSPVRHRYLSRYSKTFQHGATLARLRLVRYLTAKPFPPDVYRTQDYPRCIAGSIRCQIHKMPNTEFYLVNWWPPQYPSMSWTRLLRAVCSA